jgi:hypothetical protein
LDDSLFAQAPQGALGLVKRLFRLETTSLADFCTCNAQLSERGIATSVLWGDILQPEAMARKNI